MRERNIERALVARVKEAGGEVRKVSWPGRVGAPDRVAMLSDGRLIWVELKRPGKDAEAHQLREHKRMRAMGQRVLVINNLDQIDEVFA